VQERAVGQLAAEAIVVASPAELVCVAARWLNRDTVQYPPSSG
jgi:hypothetical protein